MNTEPITVSKPVDKPRLVPKYEANSTGLFNAITKIDHPFLQALVDVKAILIHERNYFTMFAEESLVQFFIHRDSVTLECISTPIDCRGKGSATKVMQAIVEAAKETNTVIELRTANVSFGLGGISFSSLTVAHGAQKKNKIPVAKLPAFYEKFGFVKTGKVKSGYTMEFKP